MDDEAISKLEEVLVCKVGSFDAFPTSNLGLPLCLGSVSMVVWNPVVRLATWKAKNLSLSGKITLI